MQNRHQYCASLILWETGTWSSDTGNTGAPAPTSCFLNSILYNSNLDPGQEGAMGHAENMQDARAMPSVAGQ